MPRTLVAALALGAVATASSSTVGVGDLAFSSVVVGDLAPPLAHTNLGRAAVLSASGDVLAVAGSAAVLVYERLPARGGAWALRASVEADAVDAPSIALSADGATLAVSHVRDGVGNGRVRVYAYDGRAYAAAGADLKGPKFFGASIALSADAAVICVGATDKRASAGAVFCYERGAGGGGWVKRGAALPGARLGDQLGRSVALDARGETLAVGANGADGPAGTDAGAVAVYAWDARARAWAPRGRVVGGLSARDNLGFAVALSASGRAVAAGAHRNGAGAVRVLDFDADAGAWTPRAALAGARAGDWFGWAVALSDDGRTVAVGAPGVDGARGANYGAASAWTYDGARWTLRADVRGADASDQAGYAVAVSGDAATFAVGAPWAAPTANGRVRVLALAAPSPAPARGTAAPLAPERPARTARL